MNILFITESYLPKANGMASVVRYLAEGLVKKGHSVSVATQRHEKTHQTEESINGVLVYRFDIYRTLFKNPAGNLKEFKNFVLSFKADVFIVECIGSLTSDILFPFIGELRGVKLLHSHGNTFNTMRLFKIRNNIKYTLGNTFNYIKLGIQNKYYFPEGIRAFDACIYLSEIASDKDIIEANSNNTYILHNAADDMFFTYNRRNVKDKMDLCIKKEKYIVSIANYTKQKNQKLMVQQYFESSSDDYSLVMVGSCKTDYYYETYEMVRKLKTKRKGKDVVMLVGVDRKRIPEIVNGASLYITSSEYEEYSVSLIEAMSQGVPFISTDVGNARLLPGGITLSKPTDMATTIDRLLSDEELYHSLSEKGKEFAFNHCQEKIAVESLLEIINKTKSI